MLKTVFINTLKLLFAGALVGWLLSSGKLDFKLIASLIDYPYSVIFAIGLSFLNLWLISIRWRNILSARSSIQIPLPGLVKITWIGQFFSSVLPGSVSGDLVKILYVQNYDKEFTKKFLFASILIDRAIGLCGLILLVGMNSLIFSTHILQRAPSMAVFLSFNHILVGIVVIAIAIFIYFHGHIRQILTKGQKLFLPSLWEKLIVLWDDLVFIKSKILKSLLLSLLIQFIGVIVFWCLIYPFVNHKMDIVQALAIIPIGLMTLALPVAPSGLGVGHAIFQKLFEFFEISNGASLFNLFFVITLLVNVLGAIPYFLTRIKK